jgi:hypothetical protein
VRRNTNWNDGRDTLVLQQLLKARILIAKDELIDKRSHNRLVPFRRKLWNISRFDVSDCSNRHRASLFDHLVVPLRSRRHEESQVESSKHQDNANIHYQPFPESVSEEHEIYTTITAAIATT